MGEMHMCTCGYAGLRGVAVAPAEAISNVPLETRALDTRGGLLAACVSGCGRGVGVGGAEETPGETGKLHEKLGL